MSKNNVIPITAAIKKVDFTQRFLFEDRDVRGEVVHFDRGFNAILEKQNYPKTVSKQLGEFILAGILLSTRIKFEGRLILQVAGEGAIKLMVVECDSQQNVRALAQYDADTSLETGSSFQSLFSGSTGKNTMLTMTIEPEKGQRYQGIVPLQGDDLSECLMHYFEKSEQLASDFYFAVEVDESGNGKSRAAGLLLQQMPCRQNATLDGSESANETREEEWNYIRHMSSTLSDKELFELGTAEVLQRLFHEDDIRLFDKIPAWFKCSCSRQRYLATLQNLDKQELQDILAELGAIDVTCEFCQQHYAFSAQDMGFSL